jgi:hypothetical protein
MSASRAAQEENFPSSFPATCKNNVIQFQQKEKNWQDYFRGRFSERKERFQGKGEKP